MLIKVNNLPPQLLKYPYFNVWRYETRDNEKTKVPYNPHTMTRGDSSNKATFAPLGIALNCSADGVGVGVFDSLAAIDIDHCIDDDGVLSDTAIEIMDTMNCYTERSPSGRGLRLLFWAKDFQYNRDQYYIKNSREGVEVYVAEATRRFVTVTGDTLTPGADMEERGEQLQKVLDRFMERPKKTTATRSDVPRTPVLLEDQELIERIKQSSSGTRFSKLWSGDWSEYNSQSEADVALCNILAWWTNKDAERVDQLFRLSGLMRSKWDTGRGETTYGKETIAKAINFVEGGYDPQAYYEEQERMKKYEPKNEIDVFESFGFYTVPDLTEEERKPPEFIIEGMIPCGMTFLSGAPKIRKSFMAVQMAAAVATGQPFLGHSTTQCDVAYLDLEGSKSRISHRTDRMTTKLPRNVFITNTIEERLANGLVDKLRQLHKARPGIRLIIIDTYSRSRGSYRAGGANAYDADVAFLEPVQRMAIEENIAVLFIHHDKKNAGFAADSFERLSGTMGISGSADAVLNLVADGKRFDGRATLEFNPRDAKGGEISLVFDDRFCEWQEVIETPVDIRGNPVCDWLISYDLRKGKEGQFFSYEDVFRFSYNHQVESPGEKIREQLEKSKDDLYLQFGIGVQLGVQSNGKRGIRAINLL